MKTLGILVTTLQDLDTVYQLVRAAHAKGVKVFVHLMGSGVQAIETSVYNNLCNAAEVTICRQSAHRLSLTSAKGDPLDRLMTPPDRIADLVERCDRSMIF
jgi:2,4-dienoyl-CoA reductase-like NADH-dependent reductase (Old Yellow Enzyme family)